MIYGFRVKYRPAARHRLVTLKECAGQKITIHFTTVFLSNIPKLAYYIYLYVCHIAFFCPFVNFASHCSIIYPRISSGNYLEREQHFGEAARRSLQVFAFRPAAGN